MKKTIHNPWQILFIIIEGLITFCVIFLSVLLYANWDAVKNELAYALNAPSGNVVVVSPSPNPSTTPESIIEPAHIVISKINIDALINWDIPAEQTVEALNSGVAHLKGSAKLGEAGNVFITGHSSDYVWKKNPYAAVFSLLPKLQTGDIITIRENGQEYVYKVIQTRIVNPNQVEVTKPTTTPVLTLMTCYPVGTAKQRFIVHAALVSSPRQPVTIDNQATYTLPEIKFR